MPRWKKISLISLAVILGLLLLSMLVVPWQLKKQGSAWFSEHTSRRLTIEKAFFNPFTLTVEVEGVNLTEQGSERTFVSLQRLMLSGSIRSLVDLAVILDRVELDAPFVNLELLGKQEFNFSDFTRLGDNRPKPAASEPTKPLLFSLNNIVISDGAIDFTDQTSEKKSRHQIRELTLSVPFIGNIPYLTNEYVEPQLRMLLNGAEIRANGELKPFHESLETSLSLLLDGVDLAFYAFHSPVPLPIEVKSGILDTQIDLSYRVSSTAKPKLLLGGELAITDLDLRELDGQELFRLPTLILELDWADLQQQDFNLHSLDLYDPSLQLSRDRQGRWNIQRILTQGNTAKKPMTAAKKGTQTQLPLIKIDRLQLIDGQVHFQDEQVFGGFKEELRSIQLNLTQFSTIREEKTGVQFRLQTDRDLTTELRGTIGIQPLTADLNLLVNGLSLKPYYPFLEPYLTAAPEGTLNLASDIEYTASGNLRLQQTQLALHNLLLPFTDEDRFSLTDLAITGGSLDLQQQQLRIVGIRLNGGKLTAKRLADGSLSPLKLLRPREAASTPEKEPMAADPWRVSLGKFDLAQFDLDLTDAGRPRNPQLKIIGLDLDITNLGYPESPQSPFHLSGKIGRKGSFSLTGNLAHTPLRLQAQAQLKTLPLTAFNDFIPETLNLSLQDGRLNSTLMIKLAQTPATMTGSFAGRVNIASFNLRDPLTDGDLLKWESLDLAGIKGGIGPFSLQIKEVALSQYLANILITPEGKINLASVAAAPPEVATEAKPEPAREESSETESGPPPDIRIDALTLQGGTVSFTDRHLPSTFSTTMYQLGGRITGMASAEEMQADVDLRGQLENHSPLTISGKLNPLSKDLFADLTIRFKDIDLVPMTPYSGTYLGYAINKGKLYLDLKYHIEHQQIDAKNKILIDQFTFGDSVTSEQATSLPVSLAIALLRDQNGEIHLDVPISGNLNDPSFSVAGTIFTILKNLLVKAATSPFSLLASMFGGEEDFSSVPFAAGVARLEESDREKLAKLAEMLAQRPALTLEISGFADQDKDPEAFRQEQLRQRLLAAKAQILKEEGKAPEPTEPLKISAEEYPQLLTRVYQEAKFPRPRNFLGMLKDLPPAEMEKLLLANSRAGQEEMAELAKQRALQVRDALAVQNEKIKEQLFLKKVDIYQKPDEGAASRVEFSISSK